MPIRVACLTFGCAVLAARSGSAQVRSSERAVVSQTIDGTVITVDYARPQLRGRVPFPKVVAWGEMWTPGANWATTIEVSRPIQLERHPVAAGKYSLWVVPSEHGPWTVNLHPDPHLFHEAHPKTAEMALVFPVTPVTSAPREVLTFSFPSVHRTGATLELAWGTVAIALAIEVESSLPPARMTRESAAPYVGRYRLEFPGDTTSEVITIDLEKGRLHSAMFGTQTVFLEAREPGIWLMANVEKGEIVDVEENGPLSFELENGKAVGFVVRGLKGEVWIRGKRID